MGKFINRQEELAFLEQEYLRHGSSLVIVYGRRRVGKTALLAEFIKNDTSVYEDICMEKMWELNSAHAWDFYFDKIGRWWDSHTEIDIVAMDSGGQDIIFGECKYWSGRTGRSVLVSLEQKARQVCWKNGMRREHFILFACNGFTDELTALAKERTDLILISERGFEDGKVFKSG